MCREDGGELRCEVKVSPGTDGGRVQFQYEGADGVIEEPDGSVL